MIEIIGKLLNLQEHGYGWASLAILVIVGYSTYWLLNKSKASSWFAASEDVVPPYFALPALLFALFTTALATDVWQKHSAAKDAVIREASALRTLFHISQQLGEQGIRLDNATRKYIGAVIDHEWPAMTLADHQNKESAFTELQNLDLIASQIGNDSQLSQFNAKRLQKALDTIEVSRLQRISLAHDPISIVKWASAMALSVLTLISIAVVHIRRPRAMAISIILTILCVTAAIQVLSRNRSPFIGSAEISNTIIIESLHAFDK